ncbi:MAG: nitroreductase A [Candidatus Methanofastidiosum methylothiophilum]|uniref:Nitroreductase A n=1 Tax=Candidatus Methanofastidiosum methylothiophilum TaxID=1705564 RepID=A0A150ILK0_9EURY|nr:MAG: nitroreductase A [Candidatus Methanofastidiosum methylthiophilus]KYC47946.1 MAG: nitroreductase A [Candidatus Methanofastidiosum methylthiophilus]KYC50564.1 MAG: nitroreductase A [Candidatus Methanofastidiosum methylthiophilus]
MEALDAIKTRRSVRKFIDKKISKDIIDKLLEAAMSAPSAGNQQPWHFVVIDDKKILEEVPKVSLYAPMAKEAAAAIVICGDPSLEKYSGFWVQDCSAATQNILLAAHALGIGAVWSGIYPLEDRASGFRALLGIPEKIVPLSIVIMGYPEELPKPVTRFKPERVRYNKW